MFNGRKSVHELSTFRGREPGRTQVYASLLNFKESFIVIQMVQTLRTPANILHVYIHKNVLIIFQQKLHLLVKSEYTQF